MKAFVLNMVIVTTVLFAVIACVSVSGRTPANHDSIIGVWRFVKSESSDKRYRAPSGELEMQFHDGGAAMIKLKDPSTGLREVQTLNGKFRLTPPDRVTITLNGETHERYRYRFEDGNLRMEHMDFPVTNILRRLKEFSL